MREELGCDLGEVVRWRRGVTCFLTVVKTVGKRSGVGGNVDLDPGEPTVCPRPAMPDGSSHSLVKTPTWSEKVGDESHCELLNNFLLRF